MSKIKKPSEGVSPARASGERSPLRVGDHGIQPLYLELRVRGLRLRDVAAMLGVSYGTLHAWTVGHRLPDDEQRARLAAIVGVDPGELFEDGGRS
jgi:hypothetical protein